MSRLIDADKLKNHYAWWSNEEKELFDSIVDSQPTAYNIDKVVSELQEIQSRYCFMGYNMAIDVVKRGGIDG